MTARACPRRAARACPRRAARARPRGGRGAAAGWLLPGLCALAMLAAGCSGQQAAPAASALPEADAAPTPQGPYDRDHRDEAIEAARRALRQRLGPVPMQLPQAEFASLCIPPQAPGQPASAPAAGWMVSFRAGAAGPPTGEDSAMESRRSALTLPAAPPPLARTPVTQPGRAEVTSAAPPRPAGDTPPSDAPTGAAAPGDAALGTGPAGGGAPDAGGRDLPGPPDAGGPGPESTQPPTVNAFAILGPDGVAGTTIRRYAVFVRVDGTITYF